MRKNKEGEEYYESASCLHKFCLFFVLVCPEDTLTQLNDDAITADKARSCLIQRFIMLNRHNGKIAQNMMPHCLKKQMSSNLCIFVYHHFNTFTFYFASNRLYLSALKVFKCVESVV